MNGNYGCLNWFNNLINMEFPQTFLKRTFVSFIRQFLTENYTAKRSRNTF